MNIFVLDHHPLTCEMIAMVIRRIDPETRVVAAHTFKQLNSLIDKYEEVDAVVMEPQSIGCIGSMTVAHIAQRLPKTPIIVITDAELDPIDNRYLKSGAQHVISKRDKVSKVLSTLQEILKPRSSNGQTAPGPVDILKISKRHQQLINLLGQGCTNLQMAERLGLKEQTVKVHLFRLYKIIGVKNRLQAVNFAKNNGWLVNALDM